MKGNRPMFGYVMVNKEELKVKEYDRYKAYYCGLCDTLKKRYGRKGQFLLSYDMTFLVILLTSLYEQKSDLSKHRCIVRPVGKCSFLVNNFTEYAADMTLLLSYQNLKDDWIDDKNYLKYIYSSVLKRSYIKVRNKYKRQGEAVELYVKRLHSAEKRKVYNPDLVSSFTGDMLKEIFVIYDDQWAEELKDIGYYLGRFIYLMDAYEDIDKDLNKSIYNPLALYRSRADYNERCRSMLTYMAAKAAKAFERLPLVQDEAVLRNILYSGIWSKYIAVNSKNKGRFIEA